MIILVSDTSVLIDLDRGRLLATIFAAEMPFVVPIYFTAGNVSQGYVI
jgi:hypothetical protein